MERISLIDTHAHLPMLSHDSLENILARAKEAGVATMITVSTEEANWRTSQELAQKLDNVYFTLGLHPHEAARYATCAKTLHDYFPNNVVPEKCVAIGEIGLDFYYDHAPREVQIDALEAQLTLAKTLRLPSVLHCREAFDDLFSALERVDSPFGGILHCFTGDAVQATKAVDLGYFISFSGILTFGNAHGLRDAAKSVPLERVLIETDCPYLAPAPKRGKPNEPSFLPLTAQCLSDTIGVPIEEVARITSQNANTVFRL